MKWQIYKNKIRDWGLDRNFELLGLLNVQILIKRQ